MHGKPYTPEEDTLVERLYHAGNRPKAITDLIGRSHNSVKERVLRLRRAGRLPYERKVEPWADEDVATMLRMLQDGYGYEDIALAIGRTVQAIKGKRCELGAKKNRIAQATEHALQLNHYDADHVFYLVKAGGERRQITPVELFGGAS